MALGALIIDIVANTGQLKTDLAGARQELSSFRGSAGLTGATIQQLRGPLTQLAIGATGVGGAFGRLASIAATGFAGGGPVALAMGVIAAGVFTWKHFRKEAEETAEATGKFVEKMSKAASLRLNPNADLLAEITTAGKRLTDLDKQLGQLRTRSASAGLGGNVIFGGDISKTLAEITATKAAIETAQVSIRLRGDEMVRSLAIEAGTFGASAEAVKRYAVAMDTHLTPAQRANATALLDRIEGLRQEKDAREKVADALKKQAAEQEKLTTALLANQRAWRIEAGGGGNLTQGMGGIDTGPIRGGLLSGATAEQITDSRGGLVMADQARVAALWRETWINSIRGTQDAFAEFFDSIGKEGFTLVSLFTGIADTIRRTLAQLASQQIVNAIFGSVLAGIKGPGSSTVGNLTQSQNVGRSAPSVQLVQNITFAPSFLDAAHADAWLHSKKAVLAGVVAEAASEAPAFARYIVAQGMRR